MDYIIILTLVLLSGLFSGLTLGLLSLSKSELERKIKLGDERAKEVYSVRKKGNLLLCTLLIGNVAVNATLAIFLGNVASGFTGGLIATGLIVIFGEILPQATFSKFALAVGAKTAWLVKIFIIIFYPVCGPIAWVLDKALGDEMPTIYSKRELVEIIEEHENSEESDIDFDEERIIKGALSYSEKKVGEIMTPRKKIYSLSSKRIFNDSLAVELKKRGHTRIPVYFKEIDKVMGILYVKDLVGIKKGVKLEKVCRKDKVLSVGENMKLDKLLNNFIKHRVHIALVQDEISKLKGIVTLEDVIEEVLSVEIMDESDKS